jgi:alginate O-acetyltransferase complex protein AlgI
MWLLAFSIYAALKWLTWWRARNIPHSRWRSIAYLLAWPGMEAESFLDARQRSSPPPPRKWAWPLFETAVGAALLWIIARSIPETAVLLRGWLGMLGIILLLHFGSFQLLSLFWQGVGVNARPIMSAPLRSTSLSEFWGRRWNLGFSQFAHNLIFRPLHRAWGASVTGFFVFVLSGLIHDAVISLPAGRGYGLPTLYFMIQGAGVMVERSSFGKHLGLRHRTRGWIFMAAVTAGPAFWLFHPPFIRRVILPFMQAIGAL